MKFIFSFSAYTLISLLSLISVFHVLVLLQIIPYNIVWGGRLKTESDMYGFETISLLLNLTMLGIVLIKKEIIPLKIHPRILVLALWLMCLLFFLNTLGNLYAVNPLEKILFTPITLLLSIASLMVSIE